MPRTNQRLIALLLLAATAIPAVLAYYCVFRYDLLTHARAETKEPGLYSPNPTQPTPYAHAMGLAWSCHHVGMRRGDIRWSMAGLAKLVDSASRPAKGWGALENDTHGLAYHVTEFEGAQRTLSVAACDLYEADGYHVLFFDDADVLIGAKCFPSALYFSNHLEPANKPPGAVRGLPTVEDRVSSPGVTHVVMYDPTSKVARDPESFRSRGGNSGGVLGVLEHDMTNVGKGATTLTGKTIRNATLIAVAAGTVLAQFRLPSLSIITVAMLVSVCFPTFRRKVFYVPGAVLILITMFLPVNVAPGGWHYGTRVGSSPVARISLDSRMVLRVMPRSPYENASVPPLDPVPDGERCSTCQ